MAAQPKLMTVDLTQRDRAGLQVLGSLNFVAFHTLRQNARSNFYQEEEGEALAEEHRAEGGAGDIRDRLRRAKALAQKDPVFRLERFLQRYVAEEKWNRAISAVEPMGKRLEPFIEPPQGAVVGSIDLDPDLDLPDFFTKVHFHLQPGGWDGYRLYGPALSYGIYPHIFARGGFASMPASNGITSYRDRAIALLPRDDYKRIYDFGCGSGSTARALRSQFPEAELLACDLSEVQLKAGFAISQRAGTPIHFKQKDARATGEEDESIDLVSHNALAHELPPKVNVEVFREAFRILKPGGQILLRDPPPLREVDPFQAVILDWDTKNREEPFFTAALLSDWPQVLNDIGFVDIQTEIMEGGAPWVLVATKPTRHR